ncbi:MAG: hypothetical protein WDN04_11570 [Rhodospirillales bacterium]
MPAPLGRRLNPAIGAPVRLGACMRGIRPVVWCAALLLGAAGLPPAAGDTDLARITAGLDRTPATIDVGGNQVTLTSSTDPLGGFTVVDAGTVFPGIDEKCWKTPMAAATIP